MAEPVLTVGFSVLGARAANIAFPAPDPRVDYLVVHQGELPAAAMTSRPDVRFEHLDSVGVTKSRNRVLERARGALVLFADDDIELRMDGVLRLVEAFDADPDLVLAVAAAVDEDGRLRKTYPRRSVPMTLRNAGKVATYELMVRRAPVLAAGVRFDERFGAGVRQYLGDEYIFVADLLAAGLRCQFFPEVVAMHPSTSSGSGFGTVRDAAARAVVFDRVFGRRAVLARAAFLLRRPRRFGSVGLGLRFVRGAFPDDAL